MKKKTAQEIIDEYEKRMEKEWDEKMERRGYKSPEGLLSERCDDPIELPENFSNKPPDYPCFAERL